MSTVLIEDEIVEKVFNNNVVLVNKNVSGERIFFSKGIGFGKKSGSIIAKGTVVEKIFKIQDESNVYNFRELVGRVDSEFIAVCEEAIYEVSQMLDCKLNERIHIGLIDHIYVAVQRLKNGKEVENPFLTETKTLYSREYEAACVMAKRIEKFTDVNIPDGEIGFITLHIYSAVNDENVSLTLKNATIINDIIDYIERSLNTNINKNSFDYARFCTHIKFAIKRILSGAYNKNSLAKNIKDIYNESYNIAVGASKIIEKELKIEV